MDLGTTRVSARVKFRVTCSGTARVRRRVTRSGTTQISNLGKVLGSDSGKESGIVSDRVAGQDKTCKIGRFLCFRVNPR
jgi:hypothetical protein